MNKYFIVSDIHGNYTALLESLRAAGYDQNNESHWIISAGDLFDRGFQNELVYEFFVGIERKIMIRGNHDDFLRDFLSGDHTTFFWNARNNGFWYTLLNFMGMPIETRLDDWFVKAPIIEILIKEKYPKLLKFLDEMCEAVVIDKNIITHAGFVQGKYIKKWYVDNTINTIKFIKEAQKWSVDYKFIVGHWHAFSLNREFYDFSVQEIFQYKNFIGIDACSVLFNQVFVYVVESDETPELFYNNPEFDSIRNYIERLK